MLKNTIYTHHQHASQQRNIVRILVIEQYEKNEHFDHSLKVVFEHLSYHNIYYLTTVRKLKNALESIQQNTYNAVIIDIGLSGSTGIASLAAVHSRIPNVPIIVYSNQDDAKLRTQALKSGAKYFIVKGQEATDSLKFVVEDIFI